MKASIALLTIFMCSLIYGQNENHTEGFQQTMEDFVSKKMKKHHVTGASVTIIVDNKVALDKGFGYSNLQNKTFANDSTKYPIGSVSKVVTATAVLKLYSDGIIDIDKPYVHYVPDFEMKKHFSGPIEFTIRHLLSHFAGIPRLRAKGFLLKEYAPLNRLLEYSKDEYLIAPAGKVYQYSDWGTDLLALLVERVTKTKYEKYVSENIFTPLGMDHSGFGPVVTKGYVNGKETKTYEYSYPGSDGVFSTASDLAKLSTLYFTEKGSYSNGLLKPSVVQEAFTQPFQDAPLAYDEEIGLMWDVRPLRGFHRVKKAGIHEPFYTYVFFVPEYASTVVVCSNSNSSSDLHWDIWSKTFELLKKRFGLKGGQSPIKKVRDTKKVTLTDDQMQKLEGTYSTDLGILNMKRRGSKFDVVLGAENRKGLATAFSENLLKLSVKMLGIKVPAINIFWDTYEDEIVVGEQYKSGNRSIGGSKIDERKIPITWKEAVGSYQVINNSEKEYKTIEKAELFINSFGILELRVDVNYPNEVQFQLGLSPISDTLAIIPGYNFEFFGGETIELLGAGPNSVLKLSGYHLKKI